MASVTIAKTTAAAEMTKAGTAAAAAAAAAAASANNFKQPRTHGTMQTQMAQASQLYSEGLLSTLVPTWLRQRGQTQATGSGPSRSAEGKSVQLKSGNVSMIFLI